VRIEKDSLKVKGTVLWLNVTPGPVLAFNEGEKSLGVGGRV